MSDLSVFKGGGYETEHVFDYNNLVTSLILSVIACILDICEKISRMLGVSMTFIPYQLRMVMAGDSLPCPYCSTPLTIEQFENGYRVALPEHLESGDCHVNSVNEAVEEYKREREFDGTAI